MSATVSAKVIIVEPPHLMRFMTEKQLKENVVLMDIEPDFLDDGTLRIDIKVAFDRMRIPIVPKGERYRKKALYVGSTEAEIFLVVDAGQIIQHTEDQTIKAKYTNTSEYTRTSQVSLKSDAKGITLGAGQKRSFSVSFSGQRELKALNKTRLVKWVLAMPRGENAVGDFLHEDLHLYGCCAADHPISGTVRVSLSDISYFGHDKRPLGRLKSLYLDHILHERGYDMIPGESGWKVSFREVDSP